MADLKNNIINKNIAEDTSNILIPDNSAIANGIEFKSNINSNVLNGYYNLLSEALQYLQFTGGLYSKSADYNEGNIVSLVIKNGNDYSIRQFRRNSNNDKVLNNNPPINNAVITAVNGVDVYEGGSLNTDWDKMTADYSYEALPNTVMGRDEEGASNVNMPSNIEDTSVINNKYLQEELEKGLDAKQDILTAGNNITIENNVISASGNLATKAEYVSYDSSKTNLEYITGYDFPKFKTPIPDTIDLVLTNFTGDESESGPEYAAKITKQEDGSYRLTADIENLSINNQPGVMLLVKSINSNTNSDTSTLAVYSLLSQFFEVSDFLAYNIVYELEKDECSISEIDSQFKFVFQTTGNENFIVIARQDGSEITGTHNINLNIKNRVLRNEDTNIFGVLNNKTCNLKLINDNGGVKLTGSFTSPIETGVGGFVYYNPIIENYFDLTDSINNLKVTDGITSNTGKKVEFGISKAENTDGIITYMFMLEYQDGSEMQVDDVFTFNLTPDKNADLEPIKKPAENVQDAIDSIILNKIMPIGSQYIQFAEDDGTFDDAKSPNNIYGGIWKLKYNNESVYFRTEGSLSEDGRKNGIQDYALKQMTGFISMYNTEKHDIITGTGGVIYSAGRKGWSAKSIYGGIDNNGGAMFDSAKQVQSSSKEIRVKNRLIRVWERIA